MAEQRPSRLWLGWLVTGCLLAGGYFLLPSEHPITPVCYTAFTLICVGMLYLGIRINRPPRPAIWYLFLAGQAAWACADGLFSIYAYVLHTEPYPSPADYLYLAAYPVLVAGLLLLVRSRTGGSERSGLIDACVVATGLTLLSWTYIIRPLTQDASLTMPERTISIAYPAGDVLLLVLAARLFTTRGPRTASYWLLATALVSVLAADTAFSGIVTINGQPGIYGIEDAGWLLSYLTWSVAALHPSCAVLSQGSPKGPAPFTNRRLVVLASASLLAPAVLIAQGITRPTEIDWPAIGTGAAVLFLLVVARMSGLVRQIQQQAWQLDALAHNDSLTGIPNRRAWDLKVEQELTRAKRSGQPVVVALLDLDNFKRFNDENGHQAGDQLLRAAATAWHAHMRAGDLVARYGGEEFGLILAGVSLTEAVPIIDRLRALTPLGQTFSAGAACWDGSESAERLVARADSALYEAKNSGRDRLVIDQPSSLLAA